MKNALLTSALICAATFTSFNAVASEFTPIFEGPYQNVAPCIDGSGNVLASSDFGSVYCRNFSANEEKLEAHRTGKHVWKVLGKVAGWDAGYDSLGRFDSGNPGSPGSTPEKNQ